MSWMILFKKQVFDLEVKGQGPKKVIVVRDTPPYGHAPTYQISLTYLERHVMTWTRKYYLKNNYLTLRSKFKVQRRWFRYATHLLMVMHPHTKYHWLISKDKKVMVRKSFAEKEAEAGEKIRLKQYVSLRSKGRHNKI